MATTAEYQRAWRARKRAERIAAGWKPGKGGRKAEQPCGTLAARARHVRAGEQPCEACATVYREDQRKRYQRRKAAANA